MQGTRDPAAWLAVPDAIRFQAERDWDAIRDALPRAHPRGPRRELCELLGTEPLAPEAMLGQMAASASPAPPRPPDRLFTRHRVEIPVAGPNDDLLRLSVAAYTTRDEIDLLLAALARELDAEHRQHDE